MKPEETAADSSGSFKLLIGKVDMRCSFFVISGPFLVMLRLQFPTIQQNESAIAVLPQYIQVLGSKIDNCNPILDWRGKNWSKWYTQTFYIYIYPICSFNTGEVEWHQECSISGVGAPNFGYRSVIFPAYLPYSVSSRYHKLITSQCQVLKDIYGKLEKFQSDNAVTRSSRHGISYVMLKLDVLQSRYHK